MPMITERFAPGSASAVLIALVFISDRSGCDDEAMGQASAKRECPSS
jgi:hypothetical protein